MRTPISDRRIVFIWLQSNECSEAELARRSGVSQRRVNNLLREIHGCTIERMFLLASGMDVPAWTLVVPGANTTDANMQELDPIVVHCGTRKRNAILNAAK